MTALTPLLPTARLSPLSIGSTLEADPAWSRYGRFDREGREEWVHDSGIPGTELVNEQGSWLRVPSSSDPGESYLYDIVDVLLTFNYDDDLAALCSEFQDAAIGNPSDKLRALLPGLRLVQGQTWSNVIMGQLRELRELRAQEAEKRRGAAAPEGGREAKRDDAHPVAVASSVARTGLEPIDWHDLYTRPRSEPEWMCEPLLEAGRLVALYSPAKIGKSLLTLEIAAALASGQPVLGNEARPPMSVLYLDKENTEDDILERLRDLGYGPAQLGNLHYVPFAKMPDLDTAEGGQALLRLAQKFKADLVVLDTLSRFFQGEENSNDTFRAVYNNSLMLLKAEGFTLLRLDHTGKDESAGQRGGSAKSDDVDAVWQLKMVDNEAGRLRLTRTHSRTNHGVDEIEVLRKTGPLRHEVVAAAPGAGSAQVTRQGTSDQEWIERLDELKVPQAAGRDRVIKVLGEEGYVISKSVAARVVRERKDRVEEGGGPEGMTIVPTPATPAAQLPLPGPDGEPAAGASQLEPDDHVEDERPDMQALIAKLYEELNGVY